MIFIKSMTKCETLILNVIYFYFIFITVKIACITLLLKIFIHNFNVLFFMQKKKMHSITLTQLLLLLLYLQIILCCLSHFQSFSVISLISKILIFRKSSQSFLFTVDSPLSFNTSLIYESINNMYSCHQSGTCSWRGTHRRQNQLVCSDPIIILTDKGHIAGLFQVLHIFQHFTWTLFKTFLHL